MVPFFLFGPHFDFSEREQNINLVKNGGRRAVANSFCAITYELFNQLLSNLKILLLMIEWSSSSI